MQENKIYTYEKNTVNNIYYYYYNLLFYLFAGQKQAFISTKGYTEVVNYKLV